MLLVDDEVRFAAALARGLSADGAHVQVAHDGIAGLAACAGGSYDALVLDLMLPGLSGYEVLKRLRARQDWTPVLVLSAKDGEWDLADALDLGADDYLVKPFSYVVLLARLRVLLRRRVPLTAATTTPQVVACGSIVVDNDRHLVTRAGVVVDLTPREFRLLAHLVRRCGHVVSKLELLEEVFDADPDSHPNVVEVYVGYLRRKLGRDAVITVRGEGYRLTET